jgi:hypothetical protein
VQVIGLALMAASGVFPRRFEQTWFVLIWALLLFPGEFVTPLLRRFFYDTSKSILIPAALLLIMGINAAFWFFARTILHLFAKTKKARL